MGPVIAPSDAVPISMGSFLAPSESWASQWVLNGSDATHSDAGVIEGSLQGIGLKVIVPIGE